ncbi:MAG: RlmF-related methyltransferase [Candidatus Hodarchaeales archaeon]|jgi:23S rRNA A1618 N6-methylase RlmF
MNSLSIPQKKCGLPFQEAIQRDPTLRKYAIKGENRIDLGNSQALLHYNRLILQDFLSLDFTVPPGFLIPTICSRWNFISWLIRDHPSKVLEVGTGASAILALMLAKIGCYVEATEINEIAYLSAKSNINLNNLNSMIHLTKIQKKSHILKDCYKSLAEFDAIICNPPQYDIDYFRQYCSSKKGFVGNESELVGGRVGHEFILSLLEEVREFKKSPSVYFQLLVTNLHSIIRSYLQNHDYSFVEDLSTVGTRKRYYFRIDY